MSARCEAGELRLEVLNLSRPVDSGPTPEPREDAGLGLRTLRERLAAAYGARARVEFGPVDGGMRLALALPAEEVAA